MLRLLTNLDSVERFDVNAPDTFFASNSTVKTGTWVSKVGDTLALPAAGSANAFQVFTESNRDGSAGFTPDATAAGLKRLSVLFGKMRALTDQFTGAIAVGDKLAVNAAGLLVTADVADTVVAICTKATHSYSHLGATTNVIEIFTV